MRQIATAPAVTIFAVVSLAALFANGGRAAQGLASKQSDVGAIDHFVAHISTERANKGSQVRIFVRERRGEAGGPVVLLIQGRSAAAVPSFDLGYKDYSWLAYLAAAGVDVFAMDLQGYGSSSKPTVMEDPCNTSAENQSKYLVPHIVPTPCPPSYPHSFGSFATDWDEMDSVVEFIRSLRGEPSLKINLIGWSRGGMRVIGYAALHPDKVDKLVLFAPTRYPPVANVPNYPMNMTDKRDFFADWDRQVDPRNCPEQFEPAIRETLWNSTIALDSVGSRWGRSGVRRSPAFTADGWSAGLSGQVHAPTLVVRGALDDQAPEQATRALYQALGGPKAYVTISCGSHELIYEKQHMSLLRSSVEWLRFGTSGGVSPQRGGRFFKKR